MRANDVLGIIHAQMYDANVIQLTSIRTMASVPFGCRYRFIDFPLSSMVNAGMTSVGIVTKDNYQSLMDHVGSGKPWDLARKREGMFLLPPYNNSLASPGTRDSRIDSLMSNLDFLNHARQEYVIMTDANAVYNIDFDDLFDQHDATGADITVVYKHGKTPKLGNAMVLTMDEDKRVTDIAISGDVEDEVDYSFNIFLMRKSLLEYLIKNRKVIMSYRVLFGLITFVGATTSLEVVWNFSDTMNGLMAIPNLICLLWLSNDVAKECFEFQTEVVAREKRGEIVDYQEDSTDA